MVFLDEKTLREGHLRQINRTEFVAGPTLGSDQPVAIRANFVPGGVRWSADGLSNVFARRTAEYREENIEIRNGNVILRGVLAVPLSRKRHPAIVLAPGSGKAQRYEGPWNVFFARLGMAVLSLDKRGVGESNGDYRTASMDDLAGDLLAGVTYLKGRPDIDPNRIGVHGSSQGGWTAPLMAKRSRDIAFVIARAGSGTTVADTMAYELASSLREQQVSDKDASEAQTIAREAFSVIVRGGSAAAYRAIVERANDKPWSKLFWPLEVTEDDPDWRWLHLNGVTSTPRIP